MNHRLYEYNDKVILLDNFQEYSIKNWKEQDGANYYLLKDTSNRDGSFDANDFYKDTVVNEYGIKENS